MTDSPGLHQIFRWILSSHGGISWIRLDAMRARDGVAGCEWFAVQVWSGREYLSARHLRLRGYEVFLPCYREQRRWSDRVKVVERALFAGYVFCSLDAGVVGKIVTAPGVVRIVGDDRGPSCIPAGEIEAIQRIVATRLSAEPCPVPRVGQRVRVERGPLRGIEGVVLLVQRNHRLVVSIALLQRAVAVEVDPAWIDMPQEPWTSGVTAPEEGRLA